MQVALDFFDFVVEYGLFSLGSLQIGPHFVGFLALFPETGIKNGCKLPDFGFHGNLGGHGGLLAGKTRANHKVVGFEGALGLELGGILFGKATPALGAQKQVHRFFCKRVSSEEKV